MAKKSFEIVGLDTLRRELAELPDKVAVKAGRTGATKGAAYLRTQTRRSMPPEVKKWFGFKAIKSIRLKRPTLGGTAVGARVYGPAIFKIFERGRMAYTTKAGIYRSGSPQMKRFAFWHKAIDRSSKAAIQVMVDYTKAAIVAESIKIYKKTLRARK